MYPAIKRLFDLVVSLLAGLILLIPMVIIACLVRLTSGGPALHWSERVGLNNTIFKMAKFRTMRIGTPQVATHLLADPEKYVTPFGGFLRKYSLDELPQVYNIIRGDLSFVGPRPALFNQDDLRDLRTQKGIHALKPGLTGWAQINGRDELSITAKVSYDEEYLRRASFFFDCKILFLTLVRAVRGEGISH